MTARPRMVEPWQTHIKFNGCEPRTLLERGIAQADYEHRQRLAELKAISKKLEQLDTLLPALADQGIKIQQRDLRTYDGGKTIWLSAYFGVDDKLHQALLGLGFREIERKETHIGSSKDRVNLKQGRSLVVVLEVSKLPVPQPVATEVAA